MSANYSSRLPDAAVPDFRPFPGVQTDWHNETTAERLARYGERVDSAQTFAILQAELHAAQAAAESDSLAAFERVRAARDVKRLSEQLAHYAPPAESGPVYVNRGSW